MSEKSQNPLALRIFRAHNFLLKLGQQIGGRIIKAYALFALYKIFSNGGIEALSYVCYEHMLRQGEAEHLRLTKKGKHGRPQGNMPKKN